MYSEDEYLEMDSNPETKSRLLHENIDLLILNFIRMLGMDKKEILFQSKRDLPSFTTVSQKSDKFQFIWKLKFDFDTTMDPGIYSNSFLE